MLSYLRPSSLQLKFLVSIFPFLELKYENHDICWYLKRYHDINISGSGVYYVLKKHGLNRPPKNAKRRQVITKRYEKQVPGHHIQVDVKFLNLETKQGKKVRRFQYTAVHDATRIRALKIYKRHTQANAIDFIDHDDVDLNVKLDEWEVFYNYCRPHSSLKGITPYEVLRKATIVGYYRQAGSRISHENRISSQAVKQDGGPVVSLILVLPR